MKQYLYLLKSGDFKKYYPLGTVPSNASNVSSELISNFYPIGTPRSEDEILLNLFSGTQANNVWISDSINLYTNSQYSNFSYFRSRYGLNLIGDRTYVGTDVASPSFSGNHSTPYSDYSVYQTELGEIIADPATPDILRFIDTSSRIDILSFKHTFTNLSGTVNPNILVTVFEADEPNGPWLRSSISGDTGIIFIRKSKPFLKIGIEIVGDEIDYAQIGVIFYLEIGIHEPSQKVLSDSARNILKRFPSWTALFEDSVADATPALAIPESTGGKFINSLVQESLDNFSADVEIHDINAFIASANENMLDWIYISYNVPQNINIIYGDSVELARVGNLKDLLDGYITDYSFFYDPVLKQLITLRKFNRLTVNSNIVEQEPVNIFNDFDEFGTRVGLPRLYLENNSNYKKRILDVTENMPGVSIDALKRTLRRELDLWRAYGATPDSNFSGATPQVLEISDIEKDPLYFTSNGAPLQKFKTLVSDLNKRYPSNFGYIKWGEAIWDYAGLKGEGVSRVPAIYDSSTPLEEYFQPGVGDFNDSLIHLRPLESATISFSGSIEISGFKAISQSLIYPQIVVDYDAYFTYSMTVSDPVANRVGTGFVYEVFLPPHGDYTTPSSFYSNVNYLVNSDLYVTNNFMSSNSASPEFKLIPIFDQDGYSLAEIEFRNKVYGEIYENDDSSSLNIYDAASINLVFSRTWSHQTQTYSDISVGNYKAKLNYPNSSIISNPTPGNILALASPNINFESTNVQIGSNLYLTKQELYSSNLYSNSVRINNVNDLSEPNATPSFILLSNIKNSDILPAAATPQNIFIDVKVPEGLTLFGEEFSSELVGGRAFNPYDDTEYLVPSSPNILYKEYSANGIQLSDPRFFEHATISYNSTPDYIGVYSYDQSNVSDQLVDLLNESVLWLDPSKSNDGEQIMKNYGTGGAALDAIYGASIAVGSVDPTLLTHYGVNYLYLPGVAGNYATIPDSSALDITGDIEIVARVSLDDWTPTADMTIVGKYGSLNASYLLSVNSDGRLVFYNTTNGADYYGQASSVPLFVNGKTYWIKVTLDVAFGSNRVYTFYYSEDQSTEPDSWNIISTHTVSGTTSIYSGTFPLEVGTWNSTNWPLKGKVYQIIVRNGIEGIVAADIDFTKGITSGSQTTFTESSSNAATVTINRLTSATYKSVAVVRPTLLFGGDDYLEIADNALLDFSNTESFSAIVIHRHWASFGTNDSLIAKKVNTTSGAGWALTSGSTTASEMRAIISDGTTQISSTTGLQRTSGTIHMGTLVRNVSTDTLRALGDKLLTGTTGSDTTTGTLSNSESVRIGRLSGAGSEYSAMELYAVLVFRRALTSSEINLIYDAYVTNYDPEYFANNRSTLGNGYPLVKTNYEYFEASTTPNIIYGFIDQNGNVFKNEEEFRNTYVIGDRYLDTIGLTRSSFNLQSTPTYIVDYLKFSSTPSSVDIYVPNNQELISGLNDSFDQNTALSSDVYAVNDEFRSDQFSLGINSGFIHLYDGDEYIYSKPMTETYNGSFFELQLSSIPRKGAPVIVNINSTPIRHLSFEDMATPGSQSFWNSEFVTARTTDSLFSAYENISNVTIVDTYSGNIIFNNLQTITNEIDPFNSATPAVVGREYELTYYVNDSFFLEKDIYDSSDDSYKSYIYLSSTPNISSNYEVIYETDLYNDHMNIDLSANQIDVPLDEGFIYLTKDSFNFSFIETYLSPKYISDSSDDLIYLSIVSYDTNGNIKPYQTFNINGSNISVSENYVTTNKYGLARVIIKYSGVTPATSTTGLVNIVGVSNSSGYAHPNSDTDGFSTTSSFDIIRNIDFKLELRAVPARLLFDADGQSAVSITGQIYWNNKPFRHSLNLGWSKSRTLYDLFENTSLTNFVSNNDGTFSIEGIITQANNDPDQWFARVEITNTSSEIANLLNEDGEIISPSSITITGDIVYWNERYDNLHYANEPVPIINPGFLIKEQNSNLLATPRFIYKHYNSFDIVNTNSTPNWIPPKWVPLNRFDQYQMGILGSTPNIVTNYGNIHPDSGEE